MGKKPKPKEPLSFSTTLTIIGIIVGIIAWVWPMTWCFKLILMAIVAALAVVVVIRHPQTVHFHVKHKILISVITVSIVGGFGSYPIYDQYQKDHPPSLTLKKLFETDFGKTTTQISKDAKFHSSDGTWVPFQEREFQDHLGRLKFYGFFIPSSPRSYSLCEYLANNYRNIIQEMESTCAETSCKFLGDSATTSSRDLVFSGRIYLYHEDEMSLKQLAELERLFLSNGASIIFRGQAYLMVMR